MHLYLHGFASGPSSTKARTLAARFAGAGVALEVPDLTPGVDGFERSTPLTMLAVAEGRLRARPGPHVVIGSSLGGYLSAVAASRDPSIERLVLLAPAFGLFSRWMARLSPAELALWRTAGLATRHHVTNTDRRIPWSFHEDAATMPGHPHVTVPTLVLSGVRDDVVPIEDVRAWVAATPSARLVELDDGHDLVASLDRIWEEAWGFLGP